MRSPLLAATLLGLATSAFAQQMIVANVTMVRTGWNSDSFAVVTAEQVINPANCSVPDGYISEQSLPGYRTYYAAALSALTLNTPVIVAVHNTECFSGRPKIIGINLQRR